MEDVAFIQEPSIYRGQIRGEKNFFLLHTRAMQGSVYMSGASLLEMCSRDTTMVRMTYVCLEVVRNSSSPEHAFHIIQMNHHQLRN
jgi:hypothetical protein